MAAGEHESVLYEGNDEMSNPHVPDATIISMRERLCTVRHTLGDVIAELERILDGDCERTHAPLPHMPVIRTITDFPAIMATHYHSGPAPRWAATMKLVAIIGKHRFYRKAE
jgi:hypothetical protein